MRTRQCRGAWRDLGEKQTNISLSLNLHWECVNQSEMSPTHRFSKGLDDKVKQAGKVGEGRGKGCPWDADPQEAIGRVERGFGEKHLLLWQQLMQSPEARVNMAN